MGYQQTDLLIGLAKRLVFFLALGVCGLTLAQGVETPSPTPTRPKHKSGVHLKKRPSRTLATPTPSFTPLPVSVKPSVRMPEVVVIGRSLNLVGTADRG